MKKTINRRHWRLQTENVVRKKREEENDNAKGINGFIFLNMNRIHIQEKNAF